MSRTSPSKRVRRHTTGTSNQDVENVRATLTKPPPPFPSPAAPLLPRGLFPRPRPVGEDGSSGVLPTIDRKRSFAPGDLYLLQSSRLVSVPNRSGETQSLSERKTVDRPLANKLHDKLWMTGRLGFIKQVLYSYDRKHSGMLSHEELRSAMDRINLGLSEEEKGRVLVRLDPQGQGSVTADDFLAAFDILKPLGEQMSVEQMHACELQNNVQTLRPWDSRRGEMRAWKRPERAVMGMANNAEAGSHEQQKEDLFLLSLIRGKLVQHKDRLRMMFRNADANHNSLVDKDAFVAGLASLRMNVARPQIERLFELADRDGSGSIDYEEFIRDFEVPDQLSQKLRQPVRGQKTLAEQMDISLDEVAAVQRNPLVYELSRRLYTKANCAHPMFKQFDLKGDGFLSVDELSTCCSALVPGITKRDVAALMVKIDRSGDGYLDYKEFIKSMVEAGPSNPRMVDAELRREEAPQLLRSSWAHSPIWDRPVTPRSCAASWSIPSGKEQGASVKQGTTSVTWNEEQAVHEMAVAPVIESLESGARAWTLMENRQSTSAGEAGVERGPDAQGVPDDVVSVAAPLSQSLDLSSLYRARGGTTVSGHVPSQAGSRFNRFWRLKHADTRHVTGVDAASSQYISMEQTYMRKSDPAFMQYQQDDTTRRQRHREQARAVKQANDERIRETCCAADTRSDEQEAARLARKGEAKQRYQERAVMYERARGTGLGGASLFGRLNIFTEQEHPQQLRAGDGA